MSTPLLHNITETDPKALDDVLLIMAKNVEASLITAGAKPGDDYSIRDLYSWAMPFALEVFKEKNDISYRVEF